MILNRKARFNYAIEEELEAGIVLLGSEVKSLREGRANIAESYISEIGNELFLTNSTIAEYKGVNNYNHEPNRKRKLLLHKKQLDKINSKMQTKGYSCVPVKLFFNKRGIAKVIIGLGRGKKLYDKRETIKKRDETRRMQREGD